MKKDAAKIITIFSCKGGVGKTTTLINLAGIYSLMDKKVLIMDLDLNSGGIAASLNVDVNKTIYNVVDDMGNNRFDGIENYVSKYNYAVVNDEVHLASKKIEGIIAAEKCRVDRIKETILDSKEGLIHEQLYD